MLLPSEPGLIPAETARIAKAAFPKGTLALYLRDEFDSIYTDDAFKDLYPHKGQPAEAPWRLALVTVLQFAENLSDRQTAEAVRSRIDWKYALGLALEDAGFDHTVLTKFRKRLLEGSAEKRLLDVLLAKCREKQLVRKRGCARTDSTHVLAKVCVLSRVGSSFEAVRLVLNQLAALAPEWLKSWVPPVWYERYAYRHESFHLPASKDSITELAHQIGEDSFLLLDKINLENPRLKETLPSVQTLRRMWAQQYHMIRGRIVWKSAEDLPVTSEMIATPYDPEARLGSKRKQQWTGYKMHLSETCDDDQVHLVTHVETDRPNRRDNTQIAVLHHELKAKEFLPAVHFVDAGYMDADNLLESWNSYGVQLCGPVLLNNQWQSQTDGAYNADDFTIDWEHQTATCPNGKQSISWKESQDRYQNPLIRISFSQKDCKPCPQRHRCTKAKKQPRMLGIRGQAAYEALRQARQLQNTEDWKTLYKKRAGVEGSLSQGVRAFGLRQARYVGLAKTHLQHIVTATAMNVVRLHAWHLQTPHSTTRRSRFARLAS